MPKTIKVLKHFVFSRANGEAVQLPAGEHEVDDEIANHPYVARDFADGHVEDTAGIAAAKAAAKAAADAEAKAKADAEATTAAAAKAAGK